MVTRVYRVPDVSCQHCIRAITEELRKIEGIQDIEVDLTSKTVRVVSEETVPDERIRSGIEEAGYTIAG
ncbi:heavy-metal-associated domain-containing protein [Thermomicrobium sp. 4228-Ro]|uniref:heavy-metal-associated domain-containing protein n=1 Tax=Thermomicrobium sp. 4228-Ro TaxID=2993937 RepID=UPI00224917B6|nr:heavy-metal-associated domain-containing protein [Thermomicrobium sp. 4228-Ro]MCX2727906.1 heavy-metal-associated domain-containing protein [Thermomicrobium sp. 4228-Ro]